MKPKKAVIISIRPKWCGKIEKAEMKLKQAVLISIRPKWCEKNRKSRKNARNKKISAEAAATV